MIESIYIMWKRQIKLYLRSKHRIMASLAQPLLFLVAFGFGFGPIFEQAGEGNYIQFLIPGIIGMTVLFSSVMNGVSLIWDKNFGFLKETLVAPVPRVALLMGRCLGGATTSIFQGVVVLSISFFMGYRIQNWALLPVAVLFMFLISLLFNLLGTSIASKIEDMHAFPTVMNFLVMPMFFLSGALFPIDNFPNAIRTISIINPMTYCVDLLQYTLGGNANFNPIINIGVIFLLLVVLSVIGTYLFNKIEV